MSDSTPAPKLDEHGVPFCTGEKCPVFDGKRCRATGFEPDQLCEPAVRELVADRNRLGRQLGEAQARLKAFQEISRG